MCGWDPNTGDPTEEKLAELDLLALSAVAGMEYAESCAV